MNRAMLFLLVALVAMIFVESAVGQEMMRPAKIIIGTGETPLSSGLTGTFILESPAKDEGLQVDLNNGFGEVIYTRKVGRFMAGPSVGIFENAFWVAPYATFSIGGLTTTHWVGWIAGLPGNPSLEEVNFMFSIQSIGYSSKGLAATYTLQHFLEGIPKHLVTGEAWIGAGQKESIGGSVTYDFRAKKPLFAVMAKYSF